MTDAKTRAKQLRWNLVLNSEQETVIAAAISEAVEEEREANMGIRRTLTLKVDELREQLEYLRDKHASMADEMHRVTGVQELSTLAELIRSRGPASPAPEYPGLGPSPFRGPDYLAEAYPGPASPAPVLSDGTLVVEANDVGDALAQLAEPAPDALLEAATRVVREWAHGRPALESESLDALAAVVARKGE